jgi:hypothetical protein
MMALTSMNARWLYILTALVGCGSVKSSSSFDAATPPIDGATTPPDAATCDPGARFGPLNPVPGLELPGVTESFPRLSADELTIYFDGATPGSVPHLYAAHRISLTEPFDTPTELTSLHSDAGNGNPSLSRDGFTLWFSSRNATTDPYHLYIATRTSLLAEFGRPQLARVVNTTEARTDAQPFLTLDGQELWFISNRVPSASFDLWRADWTGSDFASPVRQLALSSPNAESFPSLSADRLTVYFSSDRPDPGGKGAYDIWRSHRSAAGGDDFSPPTLVEELNTARNDYATWLSSDNCRIYGSSGSIFMATRSP